MCLIGRAEENTEKKWVHRFFTKPKTITAGGLGGNVSPMAALGNALVKALVKAPEQFFSCIKYAKTVIVRVDIG